MYTEQSKDANWKHTLPVGEKRRRRPKTRLYFWNSYILCVQLCVFYNIMHTVSVLCLQCLEQFFFFPLFWTVYVIQLYTVCYIELGWPLNY